MSLSLINISFPLILSKSVLFPSVLLLSLIKLFFKKNSCNNFALYKILFKERDLYLVFILNLEGIVLYKEINLLKILISWLFRLNLYLHISIISSFEYGLKKNE